MIFNLVIGTKSFAPQYSQGMPDPRSYMANNNVGTITNLLLLKSCYIPMFDGLPSLGWFSS